MRSLITVTVALFAIPIASAAVIDVRKAVRDDWSGQFREINEQLRKRAHLSTPPAGAVLDSQALLLPTDQDALDVMVRRTAALIADLEAATRNQDFAELRKQLDVIKRRAAQEATESGVPGWKPRRESLAMATAALRRKVVFSNPLLDFAEILFISRGVNHGTTKDGDHMITAYYGFNGLKGGGLYLLRNFKSPQPQVIRLLTHSIVENGQFQGHCLPSGAYLSPQLSYDGKTIFFAFSENDDRG